MSTSAPLVETGCTALDVYVHEVSRIMDQSLPVAEVVQLISEANHALGDARLPDAFREVCADAPYTRNLVYADPSHRFSIIAILWGPFQDTRVHDHLNWCVVKVLEGTCHAVDYDRLDDESDPGHAELAIRRTALVQPGDVVGLLPRTNIHKMSNAGRSCAISLHTYGDPGAKARVFDPVSGKVEILDLQFHNAPPLP